MALIAVAADKGSPGVTTAAIALAAVWPRPVLLAECDPAGGDLVYRLPGADGEQLDPRRGLLSLAVAARRGLQPHQVWEHTQRLYGGLDVLTGVTNAEQGSGLHSLWASLGTVLGALPQADVIADCGRIGGDGPHYDLLAQAATVVMITRASFGEVVRLRDRAGALVAGVQRRGRPGARIGVVVIAQHKGFDSTLAEVQKVLGHGTGPASIIGGLAFEPKSADQLSGQWGGKLDRSMLIRTTREIAVHLAGQLPDLAGLGPGAAPAAAPGGWVPPPAPPAARPAHEITQPARTVQPQPSQPQPARPQPARPQPSQPQPSQPQPSQPRAARPLAAPEPSGLLPMDEPPGPSAAPEPSRPLPVHEPSWPQDPLLPPLPPQRPAESPPGRRGRHAEPPGRPGGRPGRPRSGHTGLSPVGSAAPVSEGYLGAPPDRLPDPVREGFPPGSPRDGRAGALPDPELNGYEDLPPGSLPPPGPPGQDGGW
jgi:hypothetical protein